MKRILFLLLIIPFFANAQTQPQLPTYFPSPNAPTSYEKGGWKVLDSGFQIRPRTNNFRPLTGYTAIRFSGDTMYYSVMGGGAWVAVAVASAGGFVTLPQLNDTLTNYVRLESQSPTATITASPTTYEFTSGSTQAVSLIWTSGRLAATSAAKATNPLATITVGGVVQSFSQPAPGATVGGTQAVTIATNTNTTLSNVTVTTDSKTTTASVTISYKNKIYAGFVTTASPTSADIIAATNSTYVGGEFATTRNQSGALTTPSTTKYVMFASPVSFGTPNININGLGITYNITTISFTNSSGFVSSYYVAVSPFPTAGAIDSYIVN